MTGSAIPWRQIRMAALVGTHAWLLYTWWRPELAQDWRFVRSFAFLGTLLFFLASDDTRRGFSSRGAYITNPSPVEAWRLLGVVLWLVALVCAFFT